MLRRVVRVVERLDRVPLRAQPLTKQSALRLLARTVTAFDDKDAAWLLGRRGEGVD